MEKNILSTMVFSQMETTVHILKYVDGSNRCIIENKDKYIRFGDGILVSPDCSDLKIVQILNLSLNAPDFQSLQSAINFLFGIC
jgi:hypothetical protein